MNKKTKRITVGLVAVLCFLLVFALGFGLTGAYYAANRKATGTVTLDQGIKINYSGFVEAGDLTEWDKDVTLTIFEEADGFPTATIAHADPAIAKSTDEGVLNFYVRVKTTYQYQVYNGDRSDVVETLYEAGNDVVATPFAYADGWTLNADGYAYYTAGGANLAALPTTATAIYTDADMVLADWTSEWGGPETANGEVAAIIVTLDVQAVQMEGVPGEWAVQPAA